MVTPRTVVILATYNSCGLITQQLKSLLTQSTDNFDILVSDDGSVDGTVDEILAFKPYFRERLTLNFHHRSGFAKHFRDLVATVLDDYDLFLFCDQDDVWDQNKVQLYRTAYANSQSSTGLLIYSDYIIDPSNTYVRSAPLTKSIIFRSLWPGNTLGFDNKIAGNFVSLFENRDLAHDWLVSVIAFAAAARITYLPKPLVRYRQHPGNSIGTGFRLRRITRFLSLLLSGGYRNQITRNYRIMAVFGAESQYEDALTLLQNDNFNIRTRYKIIYQRRFIDRGSVIENLLFFLFMR